MVFNKKFDQWTLRADDESYSAFNLGADGKKRFYEMQMGPYGNPIIIAEPDLAFPAPTTVEYVDKHGLAADPVEKIAGVVCKRAGEVIHRFSLSNPNPKEVGFENEGAEVIIEGVRWYLRWLFSKDKKRIINYDAFYAPEKPDSVQIIELEDLDF